MHQVLPQAGGRVVSCSHCKQAFRLPDRETLASLVSNNTVAPQSQPTAPASPSHPTVAQPAELLLTPVDEVPDYGLDPAPVEPDPFGSPPSSPAPQPGGTTDYGAGYGQQASDNPYAPPEAARPQAAKPSRRRPPRRRDPSWFSIFSSKSGGIGDRILFMVLAFFVCPVIVIGTIVAWVWVGIPTPLMVVACIALLMWPVFAVAIIDPQIIKAGFGKGTLYTETHMGIALGAFLFGVLATIPLALAFVFLSEQRWG